MFHRKSNILGFLAMAAAQMTYKAPLDLDDANTIHRRPDYAIPRGGKSKSRNRKQCTIASYAIKRNRRRIAKKSRAKNAGHGRTQWR